MCRIMRNFNVKTSFKRGGFWVLWVYLWYPIVFLLKDIMSGLSNAVSHVWFGYLSAPAHSFEVSSFLRIFQAKNHIFVCTLKLNKIMNVSSFVSFDLGKLFRWSIRHWKAQTSYFSTRIFLGIMVLPMVPNKSTFQFDI